MKNLEILILRQIVFALIPLPEMTCRNNQLSMSTPVPISLAAMK